MSKIIFLKTLIIIVIGLAIGFFVGMEYKAYQIRSALQEATSDVFGEASKQQTIPTPEKNGQENKKNETKQEEKKDEHIFIEKNIGDEVELATIRFKVNRAREKQTLSGGFGTPAIAKEDAKFVVIDLNITNTTDANFTFFPDDGFRLVDDKERQFTTYEHTIGSVENYLNVRELAPSIAESGVLVYEIPEDAISYSLFVGKGGTSEIYKVILK